MTKEKRTEGLNLSYEGMLWAQFLMDSALTKREQRIARAMYEAFWCLWTVIREERSDRSLRDAGEDCHASVRTGSQ